MKCPKCQSQMTFSVSVDEYSNGDRYSFEQWTCAACGHAISDNEDAFEQPSNEQVEASRGL